MFGIAIRNIRFPPSNFKIILHIGGNSRLPFHRNITSDFTAQLLIFTVRFETKAFKGSFFQIYRNNLDSAFAVCPDSQNISGIIAQNNLSHVNRIRCQSNRTLHFIAFVKFNLGFIIGIGIHSQIRLCINSVFHLIMLFFFRSFSSQQHQSKQKHQQGYYTDN